MVIYRPLQVKATSKGPDNWNKRNIKQSVFFKFNSKKRWNAVYNEVKKLYYTSSYNQKNKILGKLSLCLAIIYINIW